MNALKTSLAIRLLVGLFFGVAVIGSLVLSACGTDDETTETATTDESDPSSTSATASSATETAPTSSTPSTEPTDSADPGTSSTATGTGGDRIDVYYGAANSANCGAVRPYARRLADDFELYRQTQQELVAGPTPSDIADGASSMFSSATADAVKSPS
ncbi:MAG: hypothetical protein OES24_14015 [Acidimicrobiia bacterium]|nr:hypothetical protein [Acidimicrobiia bacterium]